MSGQSLGPLEGPRDGREHFAYARRG
jgi:hypothetical protein